MRTNNVHSILECRPSSNWISGRNGQIDISHIRSSVTLFSTPSILARRAPGLVDGRSSTEPGGKSGCVETNHHPLLVRSASPHQCYIESSGIDEFNRLCLSGRCSRAHVCVYLIDRENIQIIDTRCRTYIAQFESERGIDDYVHLTGKLLLDSSYSTPFRATNRTCGRACYKIRLSVQSAMSIENRGCDSS